MAVFKCKMCGGDLEVGSGTTAVCDYCGSRQTVPRISDEKLEKLYERAGHFRRNNEFDKAMGVYEQILEENIEDAESYWSIVLCRYGIMYVEDPATGERIPTVNRAQYTSVFDDDNYASAIKYADVSQKEIYEKEAQKINEIQKGILDISQKEAPFDVFICYKETDEFGRRTHDSVYANELYHELTEEGFKVFFSRITLEDKLGIAYEPYIFAALNSAKVMVVLGTKKEYFEAAWVKNEWSRYLALIKSGQKKALIPAYRDMDPYDLPKEFSHLQAQDMNKLGFMPDLIRGIKKLVGTPASSAFSAGNERPVGAAYSAPAAAGATAGAAAPLLRRAALFLENKDWESADEYCEKALDIEPENANAYIYKLMAEIKCPTRDKLADAVIPFDEYVNFRNALRFADDQTAEMLCGYNNSIKERIRRVTAERREKEEREAELRREREARDAEYNRRVAQSRQRENEIKREQSRLSQFISDKTKEKGYIEANISYKSDEAKRAPDMLKMLIWSIVILILPALSLTLLIVTAVADSIGLFILVLFASPVVYCLVGALLLKAQKKDALLTFVNLLTFGLYSMIMAIMAIIRYRRHNETDHQAEMAGLMRRSENIDREISRAREELSAVNQRLKEAIAASYEQAMRCSSCGSVDKPVMRDGMSVCANCGAHITPVQRAESTVVLDLSVDEVCPRCRNNKGNTMSGSKCICGSCGASFFMGDFGRKERDAKLTQLKQERRNYWIYAAIALFVFWPVAIYCGYKATKISNEIDKMS